MKKKRNPKKKLTKTFSQNNAEDKNFENLGNDFKDPKWSHFGRLRFLFLSRVIKMPTAWIEHTFSRPQREVLTVILREPSQSLPRIERLHDIEFVECVYIQYHQKLLKRQWVSVNILKPLILLSCSASSSHTQREKSQSDHHHHESISSIQIVDSDQKTITTHSSFTSNS